MTRYDTIYQAWRQDCIDRLSNLDPDELICELDIPTELLIEKLWDIIELYVEEQFNGDEEEADEE